MHRHRILPAAAAAVLVPVAIAGCGGAAGPPKAHARSAAAVVTASLGEWSVETSSDRAKAGRVTFAVTNRGKTKHELVVLRTDRPAGALGHGSRIPETGHVGEVGDLAPGATRRLTLNLPAGHYALVCNLPGHYGLGMHADFTVS